MTAPPDPTPAGLPPAGQCDGIAGDAETTTGPAVAARLDRARREAAEGLAWALKDAAENLATSDGGHVTETRPLGPGVDLLAPLADSLTGARERRLREAGQGVSGPPVTADDIAAAVAAKEAAWQSLSPRERLGEFDVIVAVLESTLRPGGVVARAVAEALAERDRARRIAVALESEVAALTDALGDPALTHEYDPAPWSGRICGVVYDDDGTDCCLAADHPVHCTPARVRAELEGQA